MDVPETETSPRSALPEAETGPLARAVGWFIPEEDRDHIGRIRVQLYVVLSFLIAANTGLFAVLHAIHHLPGASYTVVYILTVMCAASLALPFLLKARVPMALLHTLFLVVLQLGVSSIAWFDGGLRSGAMLWMVVAPLAASFLGGARLGWASSALSLLSGAVLYALSVSGHAFAVSLSASDANLHYVINLLCGVLFIGALAALYEESIVQHFRDLSGRLREANTDLRHELAERQRAQAAAEAASRAKDTLLANMSHEFRTPLTSILGYTEILAEEAEPDFQMMLDSIARGGRRLLNTLNGVLDLAWVESSGQGFALVPTDAHAIVSEVSAQALPQATRRGLTFQVSGDDAIVLADPDALRRALTAVVDNAIRFTERGGVTLSLHAGADGAVVCVRDTGIGMIEEFVPVASEPFRQASEGDARTHEGVGIGLTIAQRLMEAMRGALTIDSVPGQGTSVRLALPLAVPEPSVGQAA